VDAVETALPGRKQPKKLYYRLETHRTTIMSNDEGSDDESTADDDPGNVEPAGGDGNTGERAGRLEEKERRLESMERELDRREEELDEREQEFLKRREENVELREELEDRERRLDQREEKIADRERTLDERERELSTRADELDQREQTLQQYVGDQLSELENSLADTVRESVTNAVEGLEVEGVSGGRFGTLGGILLALVGMVLVVGGVTNGFATEVAGIPPLFASDAGNFGASAVLIFCGLAANLAAAAGRI
jgi:ribonuclease Y